MKTQIISFPKLLTTLVLPYPLLNGISQG